MEFELEIFMYKKFRPNLIEYLIKHSFSALLNFKQLFRGTPISAININSHSTNLDESAKKRAIFTNDIC